ncbi:MAG: WG repeat-containing protein [Lewinellaceae bacterium]|nr:WG repeat-containing protein [Lewinellaceae bacterium]
MLKSIIKSTLLLLFLIPASLAAQLPLRHHIAPAKGPVVKTEQVVYKDVRLDATGKPLLPARHEGRQVVIYENGLPVTETHYDYHIGDQEKLMARVEFSHENGRVSTIKELVNDAFGTKERMKLHATFIHNYVNGVLESENVLDEDGKLLATLKYLPEVQLGSTPLVQFDEYRFEKGELQKRDRYGIQYDTSGRMRLHFQIREGDTLFYNRVSHKPPDTWRMEHFTASSGQFNETVWKSHIQYEAKGNPLLMITENPADTSDARYAVIVYRYQYVGDSDWSAAPEVGKAPVVIQPAPKKTDEIVVEEPPRVVSPPSEVRGDKQTSSNTDPQPAKSTPPKYFFPYQQIKENGKVGCQDANGRKMIPAVYDEVKHHSAPQGTIFVRQGELWGTVDPENRPLLPIKYVHIGSFGKILYLRDAEGKMGAAHLDGTRLVPCENKFLNWDGYLKALYVIKDSLVSLYSEDGKLLFAPKYRDIRGSMHRDDIWAVRREDNRWGLIDRATERILIPFEYEEITLTESPMNRNGEKVLLIQAKKNERWGFLDPNNQIIVPIEYQWVRLAADKQHFLVKQNDRLGLLRPDLSVAIPIRYVQIIQPNTNIFMPLNEQGLWGARTAEREIVPEKYQREDIKVTGKVIQVKEGDQFWLYSQTGEFDPLPCSRWEPFPENMDGGYVYHTTDGRKCLVSNHDKNPTLEFFDQYTTREQGRERKIVVLQRTDENGKTWYGIRQTGYGRCIAPMIYSELDFNVTLRHTDKFTREKGTGSQYVCALGRTSPKDPWVLIGSEGDIVRL